ncbi:MAG: hypothetical protein AAGA85_10060 [Bacteroidota bacterium]
MDDAARIEQLERELDEAKEQLYNTQSDLKYILTDNIAIKDFIQDLYESCQELQKEQELEGQQIVRNLMKNIEVFAKDHRLRL